MESWHPPFSDFLPVFAAMDIITSVTQKGLNPQNPWSLKTFNNYNVELLTISKYNIPLINFSNYNVKYYSFAKNVCNFLKAEVPNVAEEIEL